MRWHWPAASRSRNLKRWILPVAVFGSRRRTRSARVLVRREPSFTNAFSSASVAARRLEHDEGLGLGQALASGLPITAASSTAGCCTSVASTSNGLT
jgi:hypothetical protein